jgi:hypothetical protein
MAFASSWSKERTKAVQQTTTTTVEQSLDTSSCPSLPFLIRIILAMFSISNIGYHYFWPGLNSSSLRTHPTYSSLSSSSSSSYLPNNLTFPSIEILTQPFFYIIFDINVQHALVTRNT